MSVRPKPAYLAKDACVSPDGLHRYWLSRTLGSGSRTVLFVGYNPSIADALIDDATIRTEVGFARRWGFDQLLMGNLHAYRATDPSVIPTLDEHVAVGAENHEALTWMTQRAEIIVAAWGQNRLHASARALATWILRLERTRCLGVNQDGSPRHPLYLKHTTALEPIRKH